MSKRRVNLSVGVINVYCSFNNTIISIADSNGNVVISSSAGSNGFRGARKNTPYAAQVTMQKVVGKAIDEFGLKVASVKIQGPGAGRESAIRALTVFEKLSVTTIHDVTALPHNGCRAPKRRRV